MQNKKIDIQALLNTPTEYRSQIRVDVSLEDLIRFAEHLLKEAQRNYLNATEKPDIGGIELAEEVTGLKRSTIYSKVSRNEIVHMKQGGKLYFSRKALQKWIQDGKVSTIQEIKDSVSNYIK